MVFCMEIFINPTQKKLRKNVKSLKYRNTMFFFCRNDGNNVNSAVKAHNNVFER